MKQATPQLLVRTARRLFAKRGYDGTSVRAITTAARANLGAITYHFGSKRKLYEAVLQNAAEPLAAAAIGAAQGEGAPLERVSAVVRAYFNYLADNPDVAQLMLQEIVLGRTPDPVALPIRRIHGALTELVVEGQQSGTIRPGDARIMALGIISQPVHMNLVRRPLKSFTGIDFDDERMRATILEHITAFACAGLAHKG